MRANGNPGRIIEQMSSSAALTARPQIISVTSQAKPVLLSGVRYWIAVVPGDPINTTMYWWMNLIGITASLVAARPLERAGWGTTGSILPAFRVSVADNAPMIKGGGIVPVGNTTSSIQSGAWIAIHGNNLAASTATWDGSFPLRWAATASRSTVGQLSSRSRVLGK